MNRREFSAAVSSLAALATGQPLSGAKPDDPAARLDRSGDPLPPHALARLGTARYWDVMGIRAMAISPDGRLIATVDFESTITPWDPSTGKVVRRLGRRSVKDDGGFHASPYLAFTPDGATLAVSWSIERRDLAKDQNFPALGGVGIPINGVAGLPDGATPVDSRNEGIIERRDLATDQTLPTLGGHGEYINGIAYSGDGKTLASCDSDGLILLRDATTGQVLHRIEAKDAPPRGGDHLIGIALSNDGSRLVACGYHDVPITLWDTVSGRRLRSFMPPRYRLMFRDAVAISPDGKTVAVGGAYEVGIFDANSGQFRFLLRPKENPAIGPEDVDYKTYARVKAMAFSPDGKTLASTSANDAVRLWNLVEPDNLRPGEDSGWGPVKVADERVRFDWPEARPSGVAFSPDGKWLASTSGTGTIRIWDLPEAKERTRAEGHRSEVLALAFAPDGQTLVSVGGNIVCVSNPETGEMLGRRPLLPPISEAWALSPDGRTLALRPRWSERRVDIVDVASGAVVRRIDRMTRTTGVITPFFSADGKTLLVQENCSELIAEGEDVQTWFALFDPATGAELRRFRPKEGDYPDQLLLAPGGRTLASFGFAGLFLYDVASGQLRYRIELPDKEQYRMTLNFRAVAFSPDGALLGTTDEGGSLRLWDVVEGKDIGLFSAKLARDGTSIAYASNGKMIATGSSVGREGNAVVQLWEVASGRELTRFEGHQGWISALAFSPDGRRLASGSGDTTVMVWDVSPWR